MSDYIYDEYIREGTILSRDFYNLFVGQRLGKGQFRVVYTNDLDKTTVFKFEPPDQSFENRIEWEIWQTIKDHPSIARWFAPCRFISPCGTVLVQARCSVIPEGKHPDKVPKCFSDFKRDNWGWYKGKAVCVDYGARSTIVLSEGIANCSRLKKAKWWNLEDQ